MKSLRIFVFDTWYGVLSICGVWGVCCLSFYGWLGVYSNMENTLFVLYVFQGILLLLGLFVAAVNLFRRKYLFAVVQFGCLIAGIAVFGIASGLVCYTITFSERYAVEFRKSQQWVSGTGVTNLPFSVEFRARSPVYAWRDSRIAFPSGKRSGYLSGMHYAESFRVVKSADNVFILTPKNGSTNLGCMYRVDMSKESVELLFEMEAMVIPDGACGVKRRDDGLYEIENEKHAIVATGSKITKDMSLSGECMGVVRCGNTSRMTEF